MLGNELIFLDGVFSSGFSRRVCSASGLWELHYGRVVTAFVFHNANGMDSLGPFSDPRVTDFVFIVNDIS